MALGDGDDTMTSGAFRRHPARSVDAGEGNDSVDLPLRAGVVNGGAGDDTLTADTGQGRAGRRRAARRDCSTTATMTEGVTVDLAGGAGGRRGRARPARCPARTTVRSGSGPDVRPPARAATRRPSSSGAGNDVIEGSAGTGLASRPARATTSSAAGGGDDHMSGDAGDDRVEGGDGNDALYGARATTCSTAARAATP